jgi:hypothetical protein
VRGGLARASRSFQDDLLGVLCARNVRLGFRRALYNLGFQKVLVCLFQLLKKLRTQLWEGAGVNNILWSQRNFTCHLSFECVLLFLVFELILVKNLLDLPVIKVASSSLRL